MIEWILEMKTKTTEVTKTQSLCIHLNLVVSLFISILSSYNIAEWTSSINSIREGWRDWRDNRDWILIVSVFISISLSPNLSVSMSSIIISVFNSLHYITSWNELLQLIVLENIGIQWKQWRLNLCLHLNNWFLHSPLMLLIEQVHSAMLCNGEDWRDDKRWTERQRDWDEQRDIDE